MPLTPFLYFTSLLCGTLVMVIEVLGSRVLGPFFGVGLFVWTSLIAVTMIALAAGYAVGGILSDRRGEPDLLYGLVAAAGLLTLLVPYAKGPVLKGCMALGLRTGAFASSLVLFGPPLLLLGCVSPWLVRVAAREMHNLGRTVGTLYAVSTVGSVAGTVGAGFFLIARMGVDRIFTLTGVLLLLLGASWFVLFRRRLAAVAVLLPSLFAWPSEAPFVKLLPTGTQVRIVAKKDGFYGNKKVVDYSFGPFRTRELLIEGQIQGGVDLATGQSIGAYPYVLADLPRLIRPGGNRCLVVGLGAGVIPRMYGEAGVAVDAVDIDPEVVALARDWFGYLPGPGGRVATGDARRFLLENGDRYDYLVLDVFGGDATPGHLLSREAFALVKERLLTGGVLAINLLGGVDDPMGTAPSVVRTLRSLFDQVDAYPNFDPKGSDRSGNISIVAYDGPRTLLPERHFASRTLHPFVRETLVPLAGWRHDFPPGSGRLLTDDFNPSDCTDLELKEKFRRVILSITDWDVLVD